MSKGLRVLSLFDGISCARIALDRLGVPVETYYTSEVDKYAIATSARNWPDNVQLGDVQILNTPMLITKDIDLMIGGSPCQDLSIAKQGRKGLAGERSKLFFEYVRVLQEVQPKWWVLENVASMSQQVKDQISEILGVQPIMINAALVSAQTRKRLFWTNIPGITQPEDKGILLRDMIESGAVDRDKAYCIDASYYKGSTWARYVTKHKRQVVIEPMGSVRIGQLLNKSQSNRVYSIDGKSVTLQAGGGGMGAKTGLYMIQRSRGFNKGGVKATDGKTPTLTSSRWDQNNHLVIESEDEIIVRKLTPTECERLQGVPDGYTEGSSNTQRYKMLGNAFNVDVIAHILSFIPKEVDNG